MPIIRERSLPIFTSGYDVIQRGVLGSHPIYRQYLGRVELLKIQASIAQPKGSLPMDISEMENYALLDMPSKDFWVIFGGRGGWIINHTFVIGGGGYGLANDITIDGNDLQMDYGGFEFEYIWRSDAVVHFTVHTGIGWGKVEMLDGEYVSDKFFYSEPTFNWEVNIMSWFRMNAGVGYFWVDNIQGMPGLSSSDVRGITGTIVFKLGWF